MNSASAVSALAVRKWRAASSTDGELASNAKGSSAMLPIWGAVSRSARTPAATTSEIASTCHHEMARKKPESLYIAATRAASSQSTA